MCLSALSLSSSTLLTSDLANLNPIPQTSLSRASSDLCEVTDFPIVSSSALAFDFAIGEVIWLGVSGPS
ncbi:hypothetical protein N7523_006165 [Penicillium sp. IBT 18751x]|nr:hypothetical protein N7523_006165 [Penicillium sp. IBT 18751x]